jgi:hypothetical protein
MEIISLSSTNYFGLTANYTADNNLVLDQSLYYTEQGANIPLTELFGNLQDTSTNNYSNLYLTRYDTLTSEVSINTLKSATSTGFSTYLATYNSLVINNETAFLVVQEPPITANIAYFSLSGTHFNIDNTYLFEIYFLSDTLCQVIHTNNNVNRYLTVGAASNFYFAKAVVGQNLDQYNQQVFYYIHDNNNDLLVLSKNIGGTVKYVSCSGTTLALTDPVSGFGVPYPTSSIFRLVPRTVSSSTTPLFDSWVGYTANFKTNTLDINPGTSTQSVNANLLVNTEYNSITGNSIPVNILSLKNSNTPENLQSRANPFQSNRSPFLSGSDYESRQYYKLFTGSNQLLGHDNITLGYDSYTTDIVLPADQVTYFHVPQKLYPYIQLNIKDSGLIEAGAIAGDHPMKSDKIFKKLASAKYTTPYGQVSDETTGQYLCSWLSGGRDNKTKPVWVDRYYNPSTTSFIAALSASADGNYTPVAQTLINNVQIIEGTTYIFDKPSDLVFETGAYYVYQHIGQNYVKQYINSLFPSLVENQFAQYLYTNLSNALTPGTSAAEYSFNGSTYTISSSLSSIEESSQFTLLFHGYCQDWTQPFGHQLVGNFVNDGFGVFNQNNIAPTLFVNTTSGVSIFNTSLNVIKTFNTITPASAYYIRFDGYRDYYGMFGDGSFKRFDASDILISQTNNISLTGLANYDYSDTEAYILTNDSVSGNIVLQIDLPGLGITDITNSSNTRYAPDETFGWYIPPTTVENNNINYYDNPFAFTNPTIDYLKDAGTIDYYNGGIYITPGYHSRRNGNIIYYVNYLNNQSLIYKWDTSVYSPVTTMFVSLSTIVDFNIDFDGNIWIINESCNYYKFDTKKNLVLSGTAAPSQLITVVVNVSGDGYTTVYSLPDTYSQNPADYKITIDGITIRPYLDYGINNNTVILTSPIPIGYTGTISVNTKVDSFINSNIDFTNEFYNGKYYRRVLLTRTGVVNTGFTTPVYQYTLTGNNTMPVLSGIENSIANNSGYQFIFLDYDGVPTLSSTYASTTQPLYSLTSDDYIRSYVNSKYTPSNLNVKIALVNIFNNNDILPAEIITTLSGVDPGYHHFAIRFDSYHGFMDLFIDGELAGSTQFPPRKYKFSNLINRPFMFGTSTFKNNTPSFAYLKKNSDLVNGVTIKDYYLYNTPLNDFDIKFHAKVGMNIQDIHFNVPCGRRNYLEEIERYFKATIPGSKSTLFNINIKNTGITDVALQQALQARIIDELNKTAPVYSKLNNINWQN